MTKSHQIQTKPIRQTVPKLRNIHFKKLPKKLRDSLSEAVETQATQVCAVAELGQQVQRQVSFTAQNCGQVTGFLDGLTVTKTLGSGFSSVVKLAFDPVSCTAYACKILSMEEKGKSLDLLFQDEVTALSNFSHKHIASLHLFNADSIYTDQNGKKSKVAYIAQEVAQGGELEDYIECSGPFSEETCRYFFKQLLSGLSHVHSQGYAHRDLKPSNLLLDRNFDLKIVDFGFSTPLSGKQRQGINKSIVGSPCFMAPEIILQQPYKGNETDLFACAIILFYMRTMHSPFVQVASMFDAYYQLVCTFNHSAFWHVHQSGKPLGYFSESFKDLITRMIQFNPDDRLDLQGILDHPWMQGPVPSEAEIRCEFTDRKSKIDGQIRDEKLSVPSVAACKINLMKSPLTGSMTFDSEQTAETPTLREYTNQKKFIKQQQQYGN